MAKFYGAIGYADDEVEVRPGVWEVQITERNYFGDVVRDTAKMREAPKLNDDLTIDNRLSIVADPYAYEKFHAMRYIQWMGSLWKITNIDVQRPRLILTIGGLYHGQTPSSP